MHEYVLRTMRGIPRLLAPTLWRGGFPHDAASLRADMFAGATVAIVMIPQALAYALLLGLPPVHGLYAAFFGIIAGALWGSSRHMVTGPVGVMSVLTLAALVPFSDGDPARIIAAAILLAVLVGIVQLGLGIFRLGFLMRLVPNAVLIGFTVGAAVVIAMTQLPTLFGFSIARHEFLFVTIADMVRSLGETHLLTLAIGLASMLGIVVLRRFGHGFPAALIVMGIATVVSYVSGATEHGVRIMGTIPQTWPTLSHIHPSDLLSIGTDTISLALVGFLSALAVARTLATHTREHVDVNQELIGQGFANLFSGLFGGYPVSGSFSLSALNQGSGARTGFANLVAGACIIASILFLTPLLYYLPHATLAAVIIVSVVGLARPKDIAHLYALSRTDGLIAVLTCAATFLIQPQDAVLMGVVIALLIFVRTAMFAEVPEVGYHPEWHTLQERDSHPETLVFPRTLIARIDYSFVYANAERIVHEVYERIHEREARDGERVRLVVCNFSGVNTIDGSGIIALQEMRRDLAARGVVLALAYLKHPVELALTRAKLVPEIPHLHNIDEIRAFSTRVAGPRG